MAVCAVNYVDNSTVENAWHRSIYLTICPSSDGRAEDKRTGECKCE